MKRRFTIELTIAIVSILIAIGGVVVGITTRINHITHLEVQIKEIKLKLYEIERKTDNKFSALSEKINKANGDIKYLKGKLRINNGG